MLFELNRPALVLLLFSIPLLSWITTFRIHHRFLAIVALGLVCTVFVVTDSMTTQLAAMAALGAFLLCRLFPRLAVVLVVAAMVAALWLAPRMGELAGSVVSPHLETRLATGSPAARIAIWSSFGEAARAAPLYGTGFGTTSTIRESDFSSMVSHERREMLGAGHPHNAYLQIAVEFGVIGQILATFGLVAMGWSIGRRGPGSAAPRLALLAAVGATSLVGHGAWQAWWIAAIVMTIMLIQHQDLLLRRTRETLA
jgi:O-antigen ligase